jgi:hypothetical protein
MGGSVFLPEPVQDLDFRCAMESDVEGMADTHRESILRLGSQYYTSAIAEQWAGVVSPGLYLDAMRRGEVFFIATGEVADGPQSSASRATM